MSRKTGKVVLLGVIVLAGVSIFLFLTQFKRPVSLFSQNQSNQKMGKVESLSFHVLTLQKKVEENKKGSKEKAVWEIRSPAFKEGGFIPKKFTADGENISPPLSWSQPPKGTKSIALIVEDPDAPIGIFTHWIIYNIPPTIRELPAGIPKKRVLKSIGGAKQGKNDFGKIGYGGPSPPPGPPHRYIFKIYALKETLDLSPGVRRGEFLKTIQNKQIKVATLMGKYGR